MESIKQRGPYRMRTVAQRTNFAPALLRSWERRYDLLQPMRGPGGHRLYTEADLKVLLTVRDLLDAGRSIGEIASFGREALLDEEARAAQLPDESLTEDTPEPTIDRTEAVIQAAVNIDAPSLDRLLDEAFAATSPETVIADILIPVAKELRARWFDGKCSAAGENMAIGTFCHRVRRLTEAAQPGYSEWAPVVVACFPDEHLQLGALASAYWLAKAGFQVTYLGVSIPLDDLETSWKQLRPSAMVLSVSKKAGYDIRRSAFRQLLTKVPEDMLLFVEGDGAPTDDPGAIDAGARVIQPDAPLSTTMPRVIDAIREHGRRAS